MTINVTNLQFHAISDCTRCVDGIISLKGCASGAPVVMSAPHFRDGAPELVEPFDGLHPESEEYDTILSLETWTGFVIDAHKRIQVSL